MWERACSRRRHISHPLQRLTHRFREQARSHSFDRCSGLGFGGLLHLSGRHNSVPTLKYTPNVGAGLLAKAPDQSLGQARSHSFDRCSGLGFGVLRHLSGRYNSDPTLKYIPNVGAGLPAKAPDQPPSSATDPPLSRASPTGTAFLPEYCAYSGLQVPHHRIANHLAMPLFDRLIRQFDLKNLTERMAVGHAVKAE